MTEEKMTKAEEKATVEALVRAKDLAMAASSKVFGGQNLGDVAIALAMMVSFIVSHAEDLEEAIAAHSDLVRYMHQQGKRHDPRH